MSTLLRNADSLDIDLQGAEAGAEKALGILILVCGETGGDDCGVPLLSRSPVDDGVFAPGDDE